MSLQRPNTAESGFGEAVGVTTLCERVLALAAYGFLMAGLVWGALRHSPTSNEIGHVPAGICHWRYRMFELYRVNPPLPRMIATLPLLWSECRTDWTNYGMEPTSREEIPMGIRFVKANGSDTFRYFTLARWACVPFVVLGGYVCHRWARELWGSRAGIVALLLWSFNPTVLGHGALVMPDVPAAAFGAAAGYLFWRWLRVQTWSRAFAAGAGLGCAWLCKSSLLIFAVVWPILWFASSRGSANQRRRLGGIVQLVVVFASALYLVNLGYGFKHSFERLDGFLFQSRLLSGKSEPGNHVTGNRFAGRWYGRLPSPIPRDYLLGIDRQRADFEQGGRSYLRGQWSERGWWYYHLYGLGVKTPCGTLVLCLIAAAVTGLLPTGTRWRDELSLLVPAGAILLLVSSQTGFSNHVRYTLPAWPFLIVWIAKCAQPAALRSRLFSWIVYGSVAASVAGCLWAYPHCISYFNVFAGGSSEGHWHLLESNGAWGQDLLYLRDWLKRHPEARPIRAALFGWVPPKLATIDAELPPPGPRRAGTHSGDSDVDRGPQPGWYAIDVNFLHGTHWPAATSGGRWRDIPTDGENFEYFQRFAPVDAVGHSIFIYHITRADANRVRQELLLDPI